MTSRKASAVVFLVSLVLLSFSASAFMLSSSPSDPADIQEQVESPSQSDRAEVPNSTGPPRDAKPELPGEASSTAKGVLDRVFGGIGSAFGSIGESLRGFLGG